jgi:hypothetical protein
MSETTWILQRGYEMMLVKRLRFFLDQGRAREAFG